MGKFTPHKRMDSEEQARRRLLKLGVYVPPAILGVMIAGPKEANAAGTFKCKGGWYAVSACSTACCPCVKAPTGKTCKRKQCEAGCCGSCKKTVKKSFKTKAQCQAFAASFGCGTCTCKRKGNPRARKPWLATCK